MQPEFNAWDALGAIRELVNDREAANVPTSDSEWHRLNIVQRDAIQRVIQQRDADTFRGMDQRKHVELEYLYQVRGLRQVVPAAVFGEGYAGYGNSWTGNKIRLLYPQDRKRAGRESRELFVPKPQLDATANMAHQLIPLRVNIDTERFKLRDRLLWNAEDLTIPIELFVENMLEDYGLPLNLSEQVVVSLQDQLSSHCPHIYVDSNSTPPDRDEDMRITIHLDITIGQHTLVDKFEWDINCRENSPETFAVALCNDLALPMEFGPAVAHAIREQSQAFTRMLFNSGFQFDGSAVSDKTLQQQLSAPVAASAFLRRPEALDAYTPKLNQISAADLESQQQNRDRESRSRRRMGRSSRRGLHHPAGGVNGGPASTIDSLGQLDPLDPLRNPALARDVATPVYSGILPGGLDRNLDILRMVAHNVDDSEYSSVLYYFNRLRAQRAIPSAAQFTPELVELRERFIVKLKLPRGFSNVFKA